MKTTFIITHKETGKQKITTTYSWVADPAPGTWRCGPLALSCARAARESPSMLHGCGRRFLSYSFTAGPVASTRASTPQLASTHPPRAVTRCMCGR